MNRQDFVILWLSIQLSFVSWMWMKAEKKAAYLQGQADVYALNSSYNIDIEDPIYKSAKKGK